MYIVSMGLNRNAPAWHYSSLGNVIIFALRVWQTIPLLQSVAFHHSSLVVNPSLD